MISVLISTFGDRILSIQLPRQRNDIVYSIFHQGHNENRYAQWGGLRSRQDVSYFPLNSVGLSKSRNAALSNCSSKYACIMDDDVEVSTDRIFELVGLMKNEDVDVATCQFYHRSGRPAKPYKAKAFDHNMLSAAKVSSIEICVNIESLREKELYFDEDFGLGGAFPSGEEYIFITDCLKRGLKVRYYPISVGVHPDITSGADFYTVPIKSVAKRKMLKRVFGWKSPAFIFLFWLKKLPRVAMNGYGLSFTKAMLGGKG